MEDEEAVVAAAEAVEATAAAAEQVADAATVEAALEPSAEISTTETVAAAEAAVALANTVAAEAELDAAARERALIEGLSAWQEGASSRIAALETSQSELANQFQAQQSETTELLRSIQTRLMPAEEPATELLTEPETHHESEAENQEAPIARRKRRWV